MSTLSLVRDLAISGARGLDDAPLSSGFATFYRPGTLSLAVVWADADGDEALTQPVELDESGKATVYVEGPIRMLVQNSDGLTILDSDPANQVIDDMVKLVQAGWTGPYLANALAAIYASVGGLDGQYRVAPEAIDRAFVDVLGERCVSVRDWGARGDDTADDFDAIMSAYTYASQHLVAGGRGILYLPPGIYRSSHSLPINDAGVTIIGAGKDASYLRFYSADSDGIVVNEATNLLGFTADYLGNSTGAGIKIVDASRVLVRDVRVAGVESTDGWLRGARLYPDASNIENIAFENCDIAAAQAATDTTSIAVAIDKSAGNGMTVKSLRIIGGSATTGTAGAGQMDISCGLGVVIDAVRIAGAGDYGIYVGRTSAGDGVVADGVTISNCNFSGRTGSGPDVNSAGISDHVRTFGNTWGGGSLPGVSDYHNDALPGKGNVYADVSQNPVGNVGVVYGSATDTYTPNLDLGNYFNLTSAGAVTLAAPTSTYPLRPGQQIVFDLTPTGGAFTFNAVYLRLRNVTGVQTGTWNGSAWVFDTPLQDTVVAISVAAGATATPNIDNGRIFTIATSGGSGVTTIANPAGSIAAIAGDHMTIVLTPGAGNTGWLWGTAYAKYARAIHDTPLDLDVFAYTVGNVGVIDFIYDGTLWLVAGASARRSTDNGAAVPLTTTLTATAGAGGGGDTFTPNLALGNVFKLVATGNGGGGANVTVANPTNDNGGAGSRMTFILSVEGTDLAGWTLGSNYSYGGTLNDTAGWPLFQGANVGVIEWINNGTKWHQINKATSGR